MLLVMSGHNSTLVNTQEPLLLLLLALPMELPIRRKTARTGLWGVRTVPFDAQRSITEFAASRETPTGSGTSPDSGPDEPVRLWLSPATKWKLSVSPAEYSRKCSKVSSTTTVGNRNRRRATLKKPAQVLDSRHVDEVAIHLTRSGFPRAGHARRAICLGFSCRRSVSGVRGAADHRRLSSLSLVGRNCQLGASPGSVLPSLAFCLACQWPC